MPWIEKVHTSTNAQCILKIKILKMQSSTEQEFIRQ